MKTAKRGTKKGSTGKSSKEAAARPPQAGRRKRSPSGSHQDRYAVQWDIRRFLEQRQVKQAQVSRDTGAVGMSLYTWMRDGWTPLVIFKALLHLYGGEALDQAEVPFQVVKRDRPRQRPFLLKDAAARAAAAWDQAHAGWVFSTTRESDGQVEMLVVSGDRREPTAQVNVATRNLGSTGQASVQADPRPRSMPSDELPEFAADEVDTDDTEPPASVVLAGTPMPGDWGAATAPDRGAVQGRDTVQVLSFPGGAMEVRVWQTEALVPESVVQELVSMMVALRSQRDEANTRIRALTDQAAALADEIADLRSRLLDTPARLAPVPDADRALTPRSSAYQYIERFAPQLKADLPAPAGSEVQP